MYKTYLAFCPCKRQYVLKLLLTMKLVIVLLTASFLQAGAVGYAQQVTIKVKNASITQVLDQIQQQTGYDFLYNSAHLKDAKPVSLNFRNAELPTVLEACFAGQPLDYQIENTTVLVRRKQIKSIAEEPLEIQQCEITGRVTSENGEPLEGVTVTVKGTPVATTTNNEGNYRIVIPRDGTTLVFTSVGYATQESPIGSSATINITLKESIRDLDEVVVIGFGTQKKSDLTGSVASVKGEDIQDLPVKSLAEALQGRVSGVFVTRRSGAPASGSDIIIRGAASINGISPLYIVDGVRMSTGSNFNMQDVESIEILKDASSAAIYGVEAAGGVILVTTKKGKIGDRMNVDFNAYYGARNAVDLPELLNRDDYISAKRIMGAEYESWNNISTDTDWVNEMFSTGIEQKYDLALSGGSERSTYYISAGYWKEDGIRRNNWFERYSLRMNSDHKLSNNFSIGQYFYFNKTKNNPVRSDGSILPYRSIPLMGVYDETRVGGWAAAPDGFQGGNHVGFAENNIFNNNDWQLDGNFFADWNILEGLNLRATAGGTMGGSDNSVFNLLYDWGVLQNQSRNLEKALSRYETLTANVVLNYNRTFGNHDIRAMAGWEGIKNNFTNIIARTEGFPVYYMPSFATSTQNANARYADAGYDEGSQLAQFGRLNYNYAGKYLLQGTVRRDGTNKFIGDNKWGIFPSVSGAWRISEEPFIKDKVDWLNEFKLRAGWGILGSIASVGDFIFQPAYRALNAHSFDGTTVVTGWGNAKFANTDIRWEKVATTNLGLDFNLLRNRLSLALDVYDKKTTDMIYMIGLPPSAGMGGHGQQGDNFNATINIGQISNRGLEWAATWSDKIGDLSYSIGGNASFNRNKVIQIGEEGALIYDGGTGWLNGSISRTEDGYPMGQFFGYIADGIFQTDAQAAQSAQPNARSGDLIYRDLNGDGRINDADRTYIGNPWPKCFYGINIDAAYRGFDIRAYFSGQAGVDLFNTTKSLRQQFNGDSNTTLAIFGTSKFGNNDITNLPSVYQTSASGEILRDPNGNYRNVSSYFVEKGDFLKLVNLQLGYTLSENTSRRFGFNSARIYVAGSNLLTITNYSGLDPELGGVRGRGIETDGVYPQTRLISVGANLRF